MPVPSNRNLILDLLISGLNVYALELLYTGVYAPTFIFIHQICTVLCFICICLLLPSHHALFSCAYTVLKNILCVYYLTAVPYSASSFVEVRLCFLNVVCTGSYGFKCVHSSMLIGAFTLHTYCRHFVCLLRSAVLYSSHSFLSSCACGSKCFMFIHQC
jgi:hypothetical protein